MSSNINSFMKFTDVLFLCFLSFNVPKNYDDPGDEKFPALNISFGRP